MLDRLTADDFRPHVGTVFRLESASGGVDATLTEVVDHGLPPEGHRQGFSITFIAPIDTALPQGMYRVARDGGDPIDLFLVPLGPDPSGESTRYEAVFG